MIETCRANWGIGLAATQVGVLQKVAVIWPPDEEKPRVLLNPEILEATGPERTVREGCLSIPGYQVEVKRSYFVKVRGRGLDGKPVTIKAGGNLLSQILQHEIDHLDGILVIDRARGDAHADRKAAGETPLTVPG